MKSTIRDVFKHIWKAVTSQTSVFYIFLVVILIPNVILSFTENLPLAGRIANVLLPLGFYYLIMTMSRRLGLTIWLMLPIMLFGAFQLVQLDMYGRSVLAVDMFLNVATTNPGEVGELLGNLKGIIGVIVLLYLPMLVLATMALTVKKDDYLLDHRWLVNQRYVAFGILLAGVAAMGLSFWQDPDYSVKRDIYPVNVMNNLNTAVKREAKLAKYHDNVNSFKYDAASVHPDSLREIYVMVVGETSRGNNWELLGYKRPTNPLLASRKRNKELLVFNHAMSESNVTHKSVPMMLTPLASDKYSELYHTRSIITAFKEAGFATAFFSNQERNHSFIDFFGAEADTCLFIRESQRFNSKGTPQDIALCECLKETLGNGDRKLLVVLHSYGSHFDYQDRYDDSNRRFTPDQVEDAIYEARDNLVNAYDNSILATDRLLNNVIAALDSVPNAATAMLYCSDHGEDIFDDNRHLFLHASPCPSIYQLYVPLIVFLDYDYDENFGEIRKELEHHRHSQVSTTENIFHTMMEIGGISAPCYDSTNSLANPDYRERKRKFINDHNESVDLLHAGFQHQDFAEMDRLGLK